MFRNARGRTVAWIRANPALLAVLALAFFLDTLGSSWGLPHHHSWAADDISPHKPLDFLRHFERGSNKYPVFHFGLSLAVYSPWLIFWWLTGRFEIGCSARLTRCLSEPDLQLATLMEVTRAMHALMGVAIVYLVYRISLQLFDDRRGATLAALVAACSPLLVYRTHVGNPDLPATFWLTLSVFAWTRLIQHDRLRDYWIFGVTAAFALGTKEQVLGAYVLTGLAAYGLHLKRRTRGSGGSLETVVRAHLDWRLVALLLTPLLLYGLIQNVFFQWEAFEKRVLGWIGDSGSIARREMPHYRGPWALAGEFLAQAANTMGGPLFALCVAGVMLAGVRRPRVALVALLPLVSYYVVSIQFFAHRAYPRLLLPAIPLLAVFGGFLGGRCLSPEVPARWRRIAGLGITAAAVHGLLLSLNVDLTMLRDSRYAAESWMTANIPREKTIGVFSSIEYLPRMGRLGYETRRYYEDRRILRDEFLRDAPDYVVLTSRFYPRFHQGADKEFFDDLRRGAFGHRVVWDEWTPPALAPWIGDTYMPSVVNPRITILERDR